MDERIKVGALAILNGFVVLIDKINSKSIHVIQVENNVKHKIKLEHSHLIEFD